MHKSLAALVTVLMLSSPLFAQDIAVKPGEVKVIDGDTLIVAGRLFRLSGIDTPELGQYCLHNNIMWHCGLDAAYALQKTIRLSQEIVCRAKADKKEEAVCFDGSVDLARRMLRAGLAIALPDASREYQMLEEEARSAKLGIWDSLFQVPEEWRAHDKASKKTNETTGEIMPRSCVVRGVETKDGRRIFRSPVDQDYELEDDKLIAMFCSDEEAEAKGYAFDK